MVIGRGLPLLVLLGLASTGAELRAQAITTAAVEGRVTGADGAPIADATVEVTNTSSGQYWRVETSGGGRYFVENVAIGGPYNVAARAIGFAPLARSGALLTAGQRYTADFTLEPVTTVLPELVVRADANPQANPGRTGPAQLVPDSALRQLPNLGRVVVNQALLSRQVSHSASGGHLQVGGQNPIYTGVLVDGGQNTGLLSGAGPLAHSISPETVEELQVLAAPADVRYGDFAGGALSIVTQSGSNTWHGSAYGFLQNQDLVGTNAAGDPQPDFTTWQYGGSLSGPMVRNRLHFFLNADIQHAVTPDNGPFLTGTPTDLAKIGIRESSVARFDSILSNVYGLDAGGGRTTRQPIPCRRPLRQA